MDGFLPRADVGVFGGSGLYELLATADAVTVETAWGPPAAPITIGEVDGGADRVPPASRRPTTSFRPTG